MKALMTKIANESIGSDRLQALARKNKQSMKYSRGLMAGRRAQRASGVKPRESLRTALKGTRKMLPTTRNMGHSGKFSGISKALGKASMKDKLGPGIVPKQKKKLDMKGFKNKALGSISNRFSKLGL